METTAPILTDADFTRDLRKGAHGDDVGKLQSALKFMGYDIDTKELERKQYGESTQRALLQLQQECAVDDKKREDAKALLLYGLGLTPEEVADPTLYRGEAIGFDRYREDDDVQLLGLEAGTWGSKGLPRAAELARRFVGERETGQNGGAIVRLVCGGKQGMAWCGGFTHYIMSNAVSPRLFDQADYLSARSFEREAEKYGAFRSPRGHYAPHVGDVVVFTRGKAGQGHVGIVSEVKDDGTVVYISGNDGDSVRARSFNVNSPPPSLLGYADTEALAKAKGISLDRGQSASLAPAMSGVTTHSDRAILRG